MKRLAILIACAFAGVVGLASGVIVLTFFGDMFAPLPEPRDTVQGLVVDRATGAQLAGASLVCISGYPLSFTGHRDEVKTDAQGRYTLPIQYKDYHVEVRKRGYASRTILWQPPDERHRRMRIIALTPSTR